MIVPNDRDAKSPRIIPGDLFVDDRGEIGSVNDFRFPDVKRFYTISNHRSGFIRAWHGHRVETKYVTVTHGAALIAVVKIDNWEAPSRELPIFRAILSAHKPSIIVIPAGHANGFLSLSDGARLIVFSTATLEESRNDDYRFDARYWDPWTIDDR
jgi:dTDP-4-dehydrorhamnose 3,5-epimerase